MKYVPNERVDNIFFSDSVEDVLSKITSEFEKGSKKFMGVSKTSLYIPKKKMYLVFKPDEKSIDTIEITKRDFVFKELNIFQTDYLTLEEKFKELDEDLEFVEGGFNSFKLGLGIYRKLRNNKYSHYVEDVIFFSRDYKEENIPSTEDIINYYLGKK